MNNLFNEAVGIVASWVGGREDIAANLVSHAIWIVPSVVVSAVIYFLKRKARLPICIFYLATVFKLTRWLRGSRLTIDGFYYAIYDSSKSKKEENQTDSSQPGNNPNDDKEQNKESKVAECIYISTALFSSHMNGHVFRRARRKSGNIDQNDYYSANSIVSTLRIVGSFSDSLQIFFGYWLDPYKPDEVAGTVRLKWFDNNIGVSGRQRRTFLVGQWDGVNKKIVLPIDEKFQKYYGYAQTGGVWRFHCIGLSIPEFNDWREQLDKEGDTYADPSKFLDWSLK